jgi:lipopolysaccharide export system permease protein
MKKLIFTNFLKENLKNIFFFGSIFSIIIWTIQGVNYLDFITKDGHSVKIYFYYSLLNLPKIIERILPFVFFISLFIQLNKYEKNNELLIFWTHGISRFKFLNILIIYSLIILFTQILISSIISPKAQDLARSFIRNSNIDYFPNLIKEKKFLDISKNLTIYIEKKNNEKQFEKIVLNENFSNNDSSRIKIIHAKKGELFSDDKNNRYFKFYQGNIVNITNKKITNIKFEEVIYNLSNIKTKTTTFKKIQETEITNLFNCLKNFYILGIVQSNIKNLNCNLNSIQEVIQEINKRIFKPFYIPLLCLVCSLMIFTSNKNKPRMLIFIFSFLILVFSEIFVRYSGKNFKNFSLFVVAPLMIFCFTYFCARFYENIRFKKNYV